MKTFFKEPIITRKSPLILLYKVIAFAMLFNAFFVFTSFLYAYLRQYYARPTISEPTVFLFLFLIEVMVFVILVIYWFSEYILVDMHFIHHKTGILFTKEIRYNLDTINNIEIQQNPINKWLRYGDIRIFHSNDQVASFHAIPYPNQFVYLIEQKIQDHTSHDKSNETESSK